MDIKRLIVGSLQTNCYLLHSIGETTIIDPGGGFNLILGEIQKLDGRVKYIINTHYHEDHIQEDEKLRRATGAKILMHEEDAKLIDFKIDQYLREGDIIEVGSTKLKVIHTPGHTPGCICLLDNTNQDHGARFIFTGDTLFLNGIGRTDLEWSSETDMEASLARLEKIIEPGMMVYSGHGEVFEFKK